MLLNPTFEVRFTVSGLYVLNKFGTITLYPVLHTMERDGLLSREDRLVDGKIRKYYTTTSLGTEVLEESRKRAHELFKEIKD